MKSARGLAVGALLWLVCAVSLLRAQQPDAPAGLASPEPAPSVAPADSYASLEDRMAAAQSVKVVTSILGVELGSELDEAHEKLDRLCAPGTHPKEEGGEDEEKTQDKHGHEREKGKKHGARGEDEHKSEEPKSGSEEDEGHKALWQLAATDYSAVYITADDKERITSITGFLRPGKEMPFDKVGETAKAPIKDGSSVVWDVLRPGKPLSRVLAKGKDGKASTLMLFIVRQKPAVNIHRGKPAGASSR